MSDFNQFANGRFARTQPEAWRSLPFEDHRIQWRLWAKVFGIVILWIALFGLSMWSISQQTQDASTYYREANK